MKTLRTFLSLLPRAAKETVICALIWSRLDYANALYVGIPVYLLKKLQMVQNAAARLLLGIPSRISVRSHLRSLHWLPVAERVKFKSLVMAHRALHGHGPIYLQKRFSFYTPARHLRSMSRHLAQVHCFKCQRLGGSSLARKAAVAYNALPLALRNIQVPLIFKKNLKTHLFV